MKRIGQVVLTLTVFACGFLLFIAFARDDNDAPSKIIKNETVAVEKMKTLGIQENLGKSYYRAGEKYGVNWQLLAAIGFAESDHGRSPLPGVSSGINLAGCCSGMMQICVASDCGNVWQDYKVDGNGNGKISPFEKKDAVFTAAKYLSWMQEVVGKEAKTLAAAYNAGPTIVAREGIPNYPETLAYIKKIKRVYNSLEKNPLKKIS